MRREKGIGNDDDDNNNELPFPSFLCFGHAGEMQRGSVYNFSALHSSGRLLDHLVNDLGVLLLRREAHRGREVVERGKESGGGGARVLNEDGAARGRRG